MLACDPRVTRIVTQLSPLDQRRLDGCLTAEQACEVEHLERTIALLASDPNISWGPHSFLKFVMTRKYRMQA